MNVSALQLRALRCSLGSECNNGIDMGSATCWYHGSEHADGRPRGAVQPPEPSEVSIRRLREQGE